jgi:hypothetical protein
MYTLLYHVVHRQAVHAALDKARSARAGLEASKLAVSIAKPGTPDARLVQGLLAHEHYLGARNSVGENIRYLVRDRFGRPVACALFGSAAWKCADRDAFIGWERSTRERNAERERGRWMCGLLCCSLAPPPRCPSPPSASPLTRLTAVPSWLPVGRTASQLRN